MPFAPTTTPATAAHVAADAAAHGDRGDDLVAAYQALLARGATPAEEAAFLRAHPTVVAWAQAHLGNQHVAALLTGTHGAGDRTPAETIREIVRRAGGKVSTKRPVVLGVRTQHRELAVEFVDRYYVVTPDGTVTAYLANTMPGMTGSNAGGVGMMAPGSYSAAYEPAHTYGRIYRLSGYKANGALTPNQVPGFRDANHDGTFSDAELAHRKTMDGVLQHRGSKSDRNLGIFGEGTGKHTEYAQQTYSEGCQNVPRADEDAFADLIGGAGYDYTLVDQQQLPLPLPALPFANKDPDNPATAWRVQTPQARYAAWLAAHPEYDEGGEFGPGSALATPAATPSGR